MDILAYGIEGRNIYVSPVIVLSLRLGQYNECLQTKSKILMYDC